MRLLLLGLLFQMGMAGAASALEADVKPAPSARFDQTSALQFSQSVVSQQVGDYTFLGRNGQQIKLSNYRGKPVLVSFVYTGCAEVCPATTQYLAKAVKYMQAALGANSFQVLTVGFNAPWDSPQAMRDFAARQNIKLPHWEFLSADAATMRNFTKAMGFSYAYSVSGFDHISQLTLIDQEGRIYRQIYGDNFELPQLGDPLKKLVGNVETQYPGWEGLSNRIRLFCTVYDPKTGTYTTDYSIFVGMFISAVMIFFFAAWIFREWRRLLRPKPSNANEAV